MISTIVGAIISVTGVFSVDVHMAHFQWGPFLIGLVSIGLNYSCIPS